MLAQGIRLFKQGMHEVPHMVIGSIVFVLSGGLVVYTGLRHEKYKGDRVYWKRRYVVVREENFDPSKQIHRPGQKYPLF
ncbi:hypothetical protein AVEN_128695-1 [Araneus ventricosus]|uniref:Uncharacterized protein n=1 Tax=Araneus ventricosus TaxID=182803 RepID=A0A4Y2P4M1_ARAVE|nr:hypothetical protein AVEN_219687-1 [Araneus ventricosus]GBN45973.1 hypothetical protein AVEN_122301-1 [Araneus ventricosus]GBN46971.1 hypothetical protein AVEN_236924-1 [Araneus ventricosus]GBN46974.1 hypothetical protein AVEN_128695-1 [Araneus ventricosus]